MSQAGANSELDVREVEAWGARVLMDGKEIGSIVQFEAGYLAIYAWSWEWWTDWYETKGEAFDAICDLHVNHADD